MPTPIILNGNNSALGSLAAGIGNTAQLWADAYATQVLQEQYQKRKDKKTTTTYENMTPEQKALWEVGYDSGGHPTIKAKEAKKFDISEELWKSGKLIAGGKLWQMDEKNNMTPLADESDMVETQETNDAGDVTTIVRNKKDGTVLWKSTDVGIGKKTKTSENLPTTIIGQAIAQNPNITPQELIKLNTQAKVKEASASITPEKPDTLRKEFTNLSGSFITVRDAYARVQEVSKAPSAAGDLSLLFSFMKMTDPGSTVRESEFANAENAAGIPERLRAQYNKVISGERLTDDMRKDFISQAENLYKAQLTSHKQLESEYTRLAKAKNIDPSEVIIDYHLSTSGNLDESDAPPVNLLKDGKETEFDNGQVWTLKNGKPKRVK